MEKILDRNAVAEATGLSIPSIYRLMQSGHFPRPIRIGLRNVRWRESEIEQYLESRPVASGESGHPDAA